MQQYCGTINFLQTVLNIYYYESFSTMKKFWRSNMVFKNNVYTFWFWVGEILCLFVELAYLKVLSCK